MKVWTFDTIFVDIQFSVWTYIRIVVAQLYFVWANAQKKTKFGKIYVVRAQIQCISRERMRLLTPWLARNHTWHDSYTKLNDAVEICTWLLFCWFSSTYVRNSRVKKNRYRCTWHFINQLEFSFCMAQSSSRPNKMTDSRFYLFICVSWGVYFKRFVWSSRFCWIVFLFGCSFRCIENRVSFVRT